MTTANKRKQNCKNVYKEIERIKERRKGRRMKDPAFLVTSPSGSPPWCSSRASRSPHTRGSSFSSPPSATTFVVVTSTPSPSLVVTSTPSPSPVVASTPSLSPAVASIPSPSPTVASTSSPSPAIRSTLSPSPGITSTLPQTFVNQPPANENLNEEDPPLDDLPLIEPTNKGFHPSKTASKVITLTIKQQFHTPWVSWGAISQADKDIFFQRFKKDFEARLSQAMSEVGSTTGTSECTPLNPIEEERLRSRC
ncbi:hypothetical protein Fmac_017013 [Flemingia macrophylla]|uniref:Uncharacterized protein n=1 Tax=Flemingia macrophylla TaxID=520843 RepID=A0ABD1M1A5_9FABA